MTTLRLKTLTFFQTEDNRPLNIRSNSNLLVLGDLLKNIFAVLFAAILAGFLPSNAFAQDPLGEYRGLDAQKCRVVNCNSSSPPAASSNSGGSADSDDNSRSDADRAQYKKVIKEVNQVLADMPTDAAGRIKSYRYVRRLLSQQQALRDYPVVQELIADFDAKILWTSGVINDEKGNYMTALTELRQAQESRPKVFNEANHNYRRSVFDRYLASLPRGYVYDTSVVVPDSVLKEAIADRVFYDSPPGVSDRVRKGFQAVMSTYPDHWKVAKAWFQDALNHDPNNPNIMSFLAIIDEPTAPHLKTEYLKPGPDPGTNLFGQKLPNRFTIASLKTHSGSMNNKQIMKALEDIIFLQFVESSK